MVDLFYFKEIIEKYYHYKYQNYLLILRFRVEFDLFVVAVFGAFSFYYGSLTQGGKIKNSRYFVVSLIVPHLSKFLLNTNLLKI